MKHRIVQLETKYLPKDWYELVYDRYVVNNRTCLRIWNKQGEPVATATVNIPEIQVADDEVLIKDYSENEGMLDALIQAEIINPEVYIIPHNNIIIYRATLNDYHSVS